ncbi:MAG: helix-turn-helix domain-containing protein [Nitrosomonas sp.]|nr:helix-turn-helix domain-containing protein [Nitrosomonas sp.]
MSNLQRIYQLHRILASRTLPVSHQTLEEHLECSRATVNRTIESLRLYFNAPILYDRERNGYYYDT